ncbi:type III secretion system HrpP C-terminal domain-containing protein [Pseudomonas sp. SDO528_S397]
MRTEAPKSIPVHPTAPRAPQKAAPAAIQPRPDAPPSNAPLPKRSEAQRTRLADLSPREDKELEADGLFFEQLLMPVSSGQSDHSGTSGGGSSFSMFTALDGVPTQLIDELALQLPNHGNRPFSATLLMPNLGKVQIRANKRDSHWAIELGFERRDVLERMTKQHQACEDAFASALDHDVELSLQPAGDA